MSQKRRRELTPGPSVPSRRDDYDGDRGGGDYRNEEKRSDGTRGGRMGQPSGLESRMQHDETKAECSSISAQSTKAVDGDYDEGQDEYLLCNDQMDKKFDEITERMATMYLQGKDIPNENERAQLLLQVRLQTVKDLQAIQDQTGALYEHIREADRAKDPDHFEPVIFERIHTRSVAELYKQYRESNRGQQITEVGVLEKLTRYVQGIPCPLGRSGGISCAGYTAYYCYPEWRAAMIAAAEGDEALFLAELRALEEKHPPYSLRLKDGCGIEEDYCKPECYCNMVAAHVNPLEAAVGSNHIAFVETMLQLYENIEHLPHLNQAHFKKRVFNRWMGGSNTPLKAALSEGLREMSVMLLQFVEKYYPSLLYAGDREMCGENYYRQRDTPLLAAINGGQRVLIFKCAHMCRNTPPWNIYMGFRELCRHGEYMYVRFYYELFVDSPDANHQLALSYIRNPNPEHDVYEDDGSHSKRLGDVSMQFPRAKPPSNPLVYAVAAQSYDCVVFLVEVVYGEDNLCRMKDCTGWTPLYEALVNAKDEMILEYLLSKGLKIDEQCIQIACEHLNMISLNFVCRRLLEEDLNLFFNSKPVVWAVRSGSLNMIEYMVKITTTDDMMADSRRRRDYSLALAVLLTTTVFRPRNDDSLLEAALCLMYAGARLPKKHDVLVLDMCDNDQLVRMHNIFTNYVIPPSFLTIQAIRVACLQEHTDSRFGVKFRELDCGRVKVAQKDKMLESNDPEPMEGADDAKATNRKGRRSKATVAIVSHHRPKLRLGRISRNKYIDLETNDELTFDEITESQAEDEQKEEDPKPADESNATSSSEDVLISNSKKRGLPRMGPDGKFYYPDE